MSDRAIATPWVVATLVAVVLISLIDAYDVFYFYATMQEIWAAHPLWLKVSVHAGSLLFLVWLLATRARRRFSKRHTLVMLAVLLGVNLASTTRLRFDGWPGEVSMEVMSMRVDAIDLPEYSEIGSPCYRTIDRGPWHLTINGEVLLVPRLPAPMEDHGVDMFVSEDQLCSRFSAEGIHRRDAPAR